MNSYRADTAPAAADALCEYGLWWFEDLCDPLDFDTQAAVAACHPHPIAAGEALFSDAEAHLFDRHGGLRRAHGVLVFDPAHCYGLPGHLRILDARLAAGGWPRHAFWPHGGTCSRCTWWQPWGWGAEVNPLAFAPFRGAADGSCVDAGMAKLPQAPGIGFEGHGEA